MANEAETSPLSKEQMDHLLKLLNYNSSFGTPNSSLAQTGCNPNALSCSLNSTPWIIDSGAFDHMTSLSHLFNSYLPCYENERIRLLDGSFSPIARKGKTKILKDIILKSILYVPKLAYKSKTMQVIAPMESLDLNIFWKILGI